MGIFNRHKNKSDESLMAQYQQGDRKCFDEIYHRYSKRLLYFMYRLLNHNEDLAQDLLHDVFARIIAQPNRFDTNRKFKPWVFKVAANECYKHLRKPVTDDLDMVPEEEPLLETNTIRHIDNKTFKRALRKELSMLSYDHRCTFILRYQEGLSVDEVAQIMDCSSGTIKSRSHYCLKHLSQKLVAYKPIHQD